MTFLLSLFLFSNLVYSSEVTINDAPLEWLITNTLQEKIDDHGHLENKDQLVQNIFKNISYNPQSDEIILTSNKNSFNLRENLIDFLNHRTKSNSVDEVYQAWTKEGQTSLPVTLYKTNYKQPGFYYFNHIHTKLSQDNENLKFLKYSPTKTFGFIENFLNRRRAVGSVAFTDHDTDKAFDEVSSIDSSRLTPLRGIEWGGATHMCLIDIKEDWDNLANGRKFEKEESIRQSRSSGGFRIVNHPNRKGPFPYTSWLDADGIEVWNTILENSPFLRLNIKRSDNRGALAQWVNALKTGKRYTAVSGSDFHFAIPCFRERTLTYPLNFIPGTETSQTSDYLKQGRNSFITRPDAPKLTLQAKFQNESLWSHMGGDLKGSGMLDVRLYGDFSDTNKRIGGACYNVVNKFYKLFTFWKKRQWEIRFFDIKGEVIAKKYINPKWYNYKKHFKATIRVPVAGMDVIRAELWEVNKKSKSVDLLGATNPIYLNRTIN
jgi:predicted metal-dependent phosphoesterase TrpH